MCLVIFTSSLGRQDYSLAQICCIKERRTVACYGVLGTRDERWPSNLLSDDPGNALGTRQSNVISYEHRVAHIVMIDRVKRKPVST